MSRFKRLLHQHQWLESFRPAVVAVDFGSAHVKAWHQGRIYWHQAAWSVVHPTSQTVVTVGDGALKLLGKTPPTLRLVQPVKQGSLAEPLAAEGYLRECLKVVSDQQVWWRQVVRPTVVLAVPAQATPLDQKVWSETIQNAGGGMVQLVPKAKALAARLQRRPQAESGLCVVDVGAETTEVIFFWGDEALVNQTLPLGGAQHTQAIFQQVRQSFGCEIGWQTAEKLKNCLNQMGQSKVSLRGKQLNTGLPTTLAVDVPPLLTEVHRVNHELMELLKQTLSEVPAELSTQALENGIFLTGQGSLSVGLADTLSQTFKTQVIRSASPDKDVIMGLAQVCDKLE